MALKVRLASALCCLSLLELAAAEYYSYDGSKNNEQNPQWGKMGCPLLNLPETAYNATFAQSSPLRAGDQSNPWYVSCKLNALDKDGDAAAIKRLSSTFTTHMVTYFGQFVAHDITDKISRSEVPSATVVSLSSASKTASCPDPYSRVMTVNNTTTVIPRTFKVKLSRQQAGAVMNNVTTFVDGSQIYGSSPDLAEALKYSRGELRESLDGFLPMETDLPGGKAPIAMEQLAFPTPSPASFKMRVAGDRRANQNPGLLVMHHVFVKNHNRLARMRAENCTLCSSEEIYQWARQRNVGMLQSIAFYEYPSQLGIILEPYKGYDATKQPGVNSFFTTVAFRYGHAAVTDTLWRLDNNGLEIPEGHLELVKTFYNPQISLSAGIEPILRGMAQQMQGEVEPKFAAAMSQHQFGSAFVNGTDQLTVNVFRSRELGMPRYAEARRLYGLTSKIKCSEVTSDPDLQQTLTEIYGGDCTSCDAYVCGLAEDKFRGSHFGELFYTAIKEQYERLRDTDRLYFENTAPNGPGFTAQEISEFKSTNLRSIIMANYPTTKLPRNVWRAENASSSEAGISSGDYLELAPGKFKVSWTFPNADTLQITMSAKTTIGWLGIGFPKDGKSSMVDADLVVAIRAPGGDSSAMNLQDMWSTSKAKPEIDESKGGKSNVVLVSSRMSSDGWTTVVFDRPVKAQDRFDRDIQKDGSQYIIYAWQDTQQGFEYHGTSNRGIAQVNWVTKSTKTVSTTAKHARKAHGIMMVAGFVLLFPLGALCARCLRYTFIVDVRVKALLFYAHIFFMVTGCVLTSVSLGLAVHTFNVPYDKVPYGHGHLGLVTMAIVYVQFIFGIVRPPNSQQPTTLRRIWDMFHPSFGRLVMMISMLNVVVGIYIYITRWSPGYFTQWCAWVGTTVVVLGWAQQLMDRVEKLHISSVLYETMKATSQMMPGDKLHVTKDGSLHAETHGIAKSNSLTAQDRLGSTGLRQLAESLGWLVLNRQAEQSSVQGSNRGPHVMGEVRSSASTV